MIHNLIEYNDNYSGTTASLWQYHKDEPKDNITEIAVPLKCLSNFWKTLEMSLINCKINLIITLSENCVISRVNRRTTFAIADTKL